MSLMAGFDVVIEISPAMLLKLIKSNLKVGNVYANPPFEFTFPFVSPTATGTVHIIVTDLKLDIDSDDSITLIMQSGSSSGTSLTLTSPLQKIIPVLDGSVAIQAPLVLQPVPASGGLQKPAVNLKQATVTLTFASGSQTKIANALAGGPLTFTNLKNVIQTALTQALQGLTLSLPIGAGFKVVPNTQGSLRPLQFEKLEMHSIGTQAFGLFGMLFPQKPKGNSALKATSAITGAHDLCMSISPDTFHVLLFCPNLVPALGAADASALPGSCGPAEGIETQGVTITSIADSFGDGHINVDGSIEDSGFCYEAHGTFHGEITFAAAGTTLTPNLWMAEPDVDVDVPWYCGPVQFVYEVFGFLQKLINNAIFQAIADNAAEAAVDSITSKGLPSQSFGAISNVGFDQVSITTEGLTLNGTATIFMPLGQQKGITLNGSVTTSDQKVLSTGMYLAVMPLCPPKQFPYTEYAQQQTGTYEVIPRLLGLPLKILWSIIPGDGSNAIPLNDPQVPTQGTTTIPGQTVEYPFPSPNGSIVTGVDLHIGTSTSGNSIQLTNTPAEGNYLFTLKARVQDSLGTLLEASTYVQFEGDAVVIGGGYADYVSYCMAKFSQFMRTHTPLNKFVPPWVPVNYPAPETLIAYVRSILDSGSEDALTALAEAKLVHGVSFLRALSPPQLPKPSAINTPPG